MCACLSKGMSLATQCLWKTLLEIAQTEMAVAAAMSIVGNVVHNSEQNVAIAAADLAERTMRKVVQTPCPSVKWKTLSI